MPFFAPARLLVVAASLLAGAWAHAGEPVLTDHLRSRMVAADDAVVPGQPLRVGLWLEHDPHWHTYWSNPGDSGLATRIDWVLPPGFAAGPIEWPRPERLPVGELVNHGYSGTVVLPVTLTTPAALAPGETVTIAATARWLICEVECIPGKADYELTLPARERAAADARWSADFALARLRLPRADPALAAGYRVDGERVIVSLRGVGAAAWRDTTPFPATPQVVSNSAAAQWSTGGDEASFTLPLSDAYAGAPERFDLVLARGDTALAVTARLEARTRASGAPTTAASATPRTPAMGIWLALLFAFAGGVILNLMPCVFPVLSLKALGALEAGDDARELRRHANGYALGVVASFVALALLLLALRAAGATLGWGFQLQRPGFVAAMVLLFFALGLSLSGLYELTPGLAGAGQRLTEGRGRPAAFFTGVLACVVASPCTAPFMGSALGYALAQPALVGLLVFAALGLGMAAPMLLLGWWPALARRLPRPGPWMDTFKQLLAFPLYLTVVWLLWVYGEQTSPRAMAQLGAALVAVAFALWLLQRTRARSRPVARALALAVLAGALLWPVLRDAPEAAQAGTRASAVAHEPWSRERLDALLDAGRPVLVNMTAAWCITCMANERVALSSKAFDDALAAKQVVYLKGDWTRGDTAITSYLESFGRSGVPLYVLYPGRGREPIVLPQLLTPNVVTEAIAGI
jgi:thiol:disulfide interchange protein DsbD